MDENLSGQIKVFDDEARPFRGFVSNAVAKLQLERFLPDLFTQQNTVADGLFSGDGIYISVADGKQIRYSFNHLSLGETTYSLVELAVYHQELVQRHDGYIYGGWSVRIQMSSPIAYQNEPQMLQITWSGKEKLGASNTLEMGYMDMYGNGQRMTLYPAEQTVEFPHMHKTLSFSDQIELAVLQENQPFVFDKVAMSDALVGIAFHGNEQNKIPSQKILLPVTMHALYAC